MKSDPPAPLTFRHRYHKLAKPVFSTIRGKARFKKYRIGQTLTCETPDGNFTAVVTALEIKRVKDIPIEFLKADAEFPGCTLSNHTQFANLLNSFRAPFWSQVGPDTEMTVITLKKN